MARFVLFVFTSKCYVGFILLPAVTQMCFNTLSALQYADLLPGTHFVM
jgi:hypothetical protein